MAADSYGDKNEPQYAGTGVPQDAADLTQVAAYAAKVGNRRVGTTDDRNAVVGTKDAWDGLEWHDLTDGFAYLYLSGGWSRKRLVRGGTYSGAVQSDGTTGIQHGGPTTPDAVVLVQMNNTSTDVNSRYFRSVVWNNFTPSQFYVRNVDERDNTWAGSQIVRFSWMAVWNGV